MRLLLSGEGPSDLGHERPVAGGTEFVPGPMACILDRLLLRHHTGYSLLEAHHPRHHECITYVHKSRLGEATKRGPLLLPGIKYGKDTAFFTRNAQVLG